MTLNDVFIYNRINLKILILIQINLVIKFITAILYE